MSLSPLERHLMLFPILGPSSLPVEVAQSHERHANRTASELEWYNNTEHSTTSSSNEEQKHANTLPGRVIVLGSGKSFTSLTIFRFPDFSPLGFGVTFRFSDFSPLGFGVIFRFSDFSPLAFGVDLSTVEVELLSCVVGDFTSSLLLVFGFFTLNLMVLLVESSLTSCLLSFRNLENIINIKHYVILAFSSLIAIV